MNYDKSENLRVVDAWEWAEGAPAPLGATWMSAQRSWNFALYSRHATAVTLLLYAAADPLTPVLTRRLDPLVHKTGRIWHTRVPLDEAPAAVHYAWRVDGPHDPNAGHRFDAAKVLLDPYARAVHFPPDFSRAAACGPGPNDGRAPLGVLPVPAEPAKPAPEPPAAPPRHTHDLVVYEVHVKGFTADRSSGVADARRGTFRGLIDKIPYLVDLGITAVELLPVHQFDPQEGNYWGYMTLNFFAPHADYGTAEDFRALVDAMHAAGIEVWLDVVYNHSAEGDERGPTYSLRGLDNTAYYLLGQDGAYWNDTGCGNTLRTAHHATRTLILDSLRYWADDLGVDGFRFDLASILARGADGRVDTDDPAVIAEISRLGTALDVRLVAEAWDLGAYLLGRGFPGVMWRQWNGRFRDDLRSFVKGDGGRVPALATRLYGSADLFPDGVPGSDGALGDVYRPAQSVNFVTAHDGFTLYDLVSYNGKHNMANGHGGTDGADDNLSWNCGWEGDEGVPEGVMALRRRQVKNLFALLLLANGTPMFVAGDEFCQTQGGNNNPYNQDNATTWLDWTRLEQFADVHAFVRSMIAFRAAHRSIGRSRFWREDVQWVGPSGPADFGPGSRFLGYVLAGARFAEPDLCVLVNAGESPVTVALPSPAQRAGAGPAGPAWRRVVDTAGPTGEEFATAAAVPAGSSWPVAPRSVVVLESAG